MIKYLDLKAVTAMHGNEIADALRSENPTAAKVEPQHGVHLPCRFARIDGEPLEQFPTPLKICLQRRNKERFAKSARAREKIILPLRHEAIHKRRFIDVNRMLAPDIFERLHPNGKLAPRYTIVAFHSSRSTRSRSIACHDPEIDRPQILVEIHPNLDNSLRPCFVLNRISLFIDLLQCFFGRSIEFEFK